MAKQRLTDLEVFEDMLVRAEIHCYTKTTNGLGNVSLSIEGGYVGFHSVLTFKQDGSLLTIEAFE